MFKWVAVPQRELTNLSNMYSSGVNGVRIYPSPYEIPDAVRGYMDSSRKKFIIELKYIGNEQTKLIDHDSNTSLRIGVNSKRLYGLEIYFDSKQEDSSLLKSTLKQELKDTFNQLKNRPSNTMNYEYAKSAIQSTEKMILADL